MAPSKTAKKPTLYGTVYRNTQFLHAVKKIVMTIEVYKPYQKKFYLAAVDSGFHVEEIDSTRFKTTYKVTADRETQQMDLWNFSTRLSHSFF